VAFVNQAEEYLFNEKDPKRFVKLREQIDKVKSGEIVLTEWVDDIEAYVENL
jgi:hypothetical protein